MKRVILAVIGAGTLIGLGLFINRAKLEEVSGLERAIESAPAPQRLESQPVNQSEGLPQGSSRPKTGAETPTPAERLIPAAPNIRFDFNRAIETLVSTRSSFREKQAAWNGLRDAGQIDQAISELEQRMANDPQTAEYAAALGEAYMKKCATMTDVREQAILAMKADKTLETALNMDPSNWEARFIKAVGMSYWPANLNKSGEVVEQFLTLIQQQEAQPKEPQFAQPYLWLGKEYEKAGQAEYAAQVWQRGAALFPENKELQNKVVK